MAMPDQSYAIEMIAQRPAQLKIAETGVMSQFEFYLTAFRERLLFGKRERPVSTRTGQSNFRKAVIQRST